jgi:exodeoxyribonuclease-3
LKIATFNVNGINGRLDSLLRWLKESAPDIVCLQELKAPDERFPEAVLIKAGYGAVWHGQKSWNGVAFSRGVPSQKKYAAIFPETPMTYIAGTLNAASLS